MTFPTQYRIGIIGMGVVGHAISNAVNSPVVAIDINPSRADGTYGEIVECDCIFVCVPSPTLADGSCDTSILESVLAKLKFYKGVIISKVTAPPAVYKRLGDEYSNLVYSPEFLTAQNADNDFRFGTFMIIGGEYRAYVHEAERIMRTIQSDAVAVRCCSIEEAAYAKYAINTFLATKVIFMNELEQLVSSSGTNFDNVARLITMDPRIGNSHMQVPGPDGYRGFGGMCFPKDTEALLNVAETANIELSVLSAAVQKNTLIRLQDK